MTRAQEVKKLARSNNIDYVGIAAADSLENEPEGRRPSDYLPGARSVISLGVRLSLGLQVANKIAHLHLRHAIYSYLWHGFGLPSLHYLDRVALLITRLLEKEGYLAVPVMAASTFDIRSNLMEFSNIHAAAAAGIGELCWSDLLLTPDWGPRVRFGSVITTAPLRTDKVYTGPALFDPAGCRKAGENVPLCGALCPTRAIGPQTEKIVIGGRVSEIARIDRWRCTWGSMGLTKGACGLREIPMPEKVGPEEIFSALKERDPVQSMELMVIGRGDYCGKCIMECPVGTSPRVKEAMSKVKTGRRT